MIKRINDIEFVFFLILILLSSVACSEKKQESLVIEPPATQKKIKVVVGSSTNSPISSIGIELDPHFLSQNVTRNEDAVAGDWERIVVSRMKKMQVQHIRMMMLPHWWEPVNDNADATVADKSRFTFDSQEMQSVYQVLDMAQANHIGVTLVVWGCVMKMDLLSGINHGQRHFLCDERSRIFNPGWIAGTDQYEEFAENVSTLIKYLIEDKHYTCIDQITPFNEPDSHINGYGRLMWQGDLQTMGRSDTYAPMVKALVRRFKTDGIRAKVKFNLSDNTDGTPGYLAACVSSFTHGEADLYNTHVYKFGYDTKNSTWLAWEKYNVSAVKGMPHYIGEFGFPSMGSSRQVGIDTYMRGVHLVRAALNYLNAGACGVSYWALFDQYYNRHDPYEVMQQLGLWRYVRSAYRADNDIYQKIKEDYEVRPQYYAYGLLTRFVRSGSQVYPLDLSDEHQAGSAFRDMNGKWVYVLANATATDDLIELKNSHLTTARFDVYQYMEGRLPKGDSPIESSSVLEIKDGVLSFKLHRSSIQVIVQK